MQSCFNTYILIKKSSLAIFVIPKLSYVTIAYDTWGVKTNILESHLLESIHPFPFYQGIKESYIAYSQKYYPPFCMQLDKNENRVCTRKQDSGIPAIFKKFHTKKFLVCPAAEIVQHGNSHCRLFQLLQINLKTLKKFQVYCIVFFY